jgi:pimeloyl-ACP methyl ester carboxylesterase
MKRDSATGALPAQSVSAFPHSPFAPRWCGARLVAILLGAALSLGAGSPAQCAQNCDDIDAGKCSITLNTGITMAYLEAGPASGEAVIFLHGFTDTARMWLPTMRTLRERNPNLRMLALDQRGHGDTSMPPAAGCARTPEACFRMSDYAADTLAFMAAKNIAKATFVGFSMGSFVSQEIALTQPERVRRVVLIGTSSKVVENPVVRDYMLKEPIEGAWKQALEAQGLEYPADFYLKTPRDADPKIYEWLTGVWLLDPIADPALIESSRAEYANIKLGTWIGTARAFLTIDNSERLRSIRVPVLVIWGVQDGLLPHDPDQAGLKAALDAAAAAGGTSYAWKQYGVIPLPQSGVQESDIGHVVPWDAPRELALDIAAFIADGKPTPDLYRAEAPGNLTRIVTEAGKASIVQRP